MKVVIIANPTAGRRKVAVVDKAAAMLRERGAEVEVRHTRRRGDGEVLAREAVIEKPDIVVAAGGDGTINEVAHGLAYSGVPMGVLPMGTANVFALEIGLTGGLGQAIDTLLNGRRETIHLGKADDRYFLIMAGVGFDAQVVYELDLGLKKKLGKLAYVWTALKVLARPPACLLDITVDGERLQGYGAIIGNGRYYGGAFQVTPLAGLDKPEMDICIFTRSGVWGLVQSFIRVALGRNVDAPGITYRKGKDISVRSSEAVYVQADGDSMGRLPMDFSVAENALTIMWPMS